MQALARLSFRHRRIVLAAWLSTLVAVGALVGIVGTGYDDQFSLPDTESTQAFDLLSEVAPSAAGDQLTAVVAAPEGRADEGPARERFTAAMLAAQELDVVAAVSSPYDEGGQAQVSEDGRIAFATITLAGSVPNDVTSVQVEDVLEAVNAEAGDGVRIAVTGNAAAAQPEQGPAELLGLAAAAVVLFLVFGSFVAMSLPLITAVVSIAISVGVVGLLANLVTVATFAPTLAVLLGLGVGVDYALFIVTRHRQGLLERRTPEQAAIAALDTSGRAVLFAGVVVCIALLGLFSLGLSFLYGVALAASLSVATTVLASLTLLPALLGFFGHRVLPKRLRGEVPADALQEEGPRWRRYAALLGRRPRVLVAAALVVMVALALPLGAIRLGLADQGGDPDGSSTRVGYDLLAEGFGAGFNGPLLVVTDLGDDPDPSATARLVEALQADPDVAGVTPTAFLGGPDPTQPAPGGVGVTTVYPGSAPQDEATSDLLERLRSDLVPAALAGGQGQQVYVGGATAVFEDFDAAIAAKLPLFVGVVVGLSFLLLTVVFRSLVVATIAAGANLLSAGAAFGVVVAVFQWGWGAELIGVDRTGPIISFLPVLLFAILFGLSMDYEVFLLSRIHEEWVHRGDNRQAVLHGLAATGRTITAAAAIMVFLFLAFVLGPDLIIKLFGLGLAVAVLLDALVIRMVLVPGLMLVLGRANWWLPGWLDRVLPRLSVEGSSHSSLAAEPQPEPAVSPAGR